MDLSRLSQGERIVLIAGVLLIIDLLFLPWHSIDIGGAAEALGVDTTRSGVQSPNAFYGVVALHPHARDGGQIVLDKLTSVALPEPAGAVGAGAPHRGDRRGGACSSSSSSRRPSSSASAPTSACSPAWPSRSAATPIAQEHGRLV